MIKNIYIAIDDSGKLSTKENISVYAGIIFFNKKELDNFKYKYKNLISAIKKKYEIQNIELKHYTLLPKDRKFILAYLKKYYLLAGIINNNNIYQNILKSKKSKGRYLDYILKLTIKNCINNLIVENKINSNDNIELNILIDEQNYKSNGYYNLQESIYKELKYGMSNITKNSLYHPLITGNLTLKIKFINSKKSYLIQAADIIAGSVRKKIIQNKKIDFINYKIYFPK